MFNYGLIEDVYNMMYEEALVKERRYMDRVKEILRHKDPPSPTDQTLLNTKDPEQFFNLLLNGYNGTSASATVNVASKNSTYTVNINGKRTTYKVDPIYQKKIDGLIKVGKTSQAAGYLFELADKVILEDLMKHLTSGLKDITTLGNSVSHVDKYERDYELSYLYSESEFDKGAINQSLFPIEVKARIDDFHVANARNDGNLDVSDYKNYLDQPKQQKGYQGYDVYEYIKMKLVREKLEDNYPIFHSINSANLGSMLSSTMLRKNYNFYLKNTTSHMPSDTQIFAMAKQIVEDISNDVQIDLLEFYPQSGDHALTSARLNDPEMEKFTKKILKRVIDNAAAGMSVKGFSLWYGRRF